MEMTTSFNLQRVLRLLYWVFFKPITLQQYFKSIDPHYRPIRQRRSILVSVLVQSWQDSPAVRRAVVDAFWALCIGVVVLSPVGVLVSNQINVLEGLTSLSTTRLVDNSLLSIALGVAFGVVGGVLFGVVGGVAGVMTGGVAIGVAFGVAFGMASGVVPLVVFGAAFGVALGVALGVAFGVMAGMAYGVAFSVAGGAAVSVAGGAAVSVAFGVAGAVVFSVTLFLSWILGCLQLYRYIIEWPFNAGLFVLARMLPGRATALYRWSPVHWDELIWPPLTWLDQQIVLVAEQDVERGRQEITQVASSFRQGWAAQAALVELGARSMERATALDEIAQLPHGRWWPGQWQTMPQLAMLADHTSGFFEALGHGLEATTNLNRWKRLKVASEKLAGVQMSLGGADRKVAVRYGPIFAKWQSILKAYIERLGAELELENPYVAGNPIDAENSRLFTGRDDVLREIEEALLASGQKPTLVLYGPRRSGKTSLLLQLPRRLEEDVIPIHVDMQGATQVKGLGGVLFNIAERAVKGAASGRGVELPMPMLEDFSVEPVIAFNRWLDQAEARLDNHVLFLALDEFEKIQLAIDKGVLDTSILDMLRNLIQFRRKLVLLLAGVSTLEEMGHDWHSYFISVRPIRVSYLKSEDVRQLITKPKDDFGLEYEPEAVERIITATHCQPFLVQLICLELVNYLNSRERRAQGAWDCAKLADVEQAIQRALRSGEPYFANVWSDSSPVEQRILIALAASISFEPDRAALNHLQRRDLIEPVDGGGWRFQVEIIREWVRREKT
jgi:hypothetical protein